jgi:growth factor-regulated tyrosine kinase substrate
MQSKLSQAVSLYGSILDGQQAFAARQMQEQQQRQYAQQQQYQQQPYGYNPYAAAPWPQTNGHGSSWYAPPQQSVHTAQPAQAGPSLYPSMPSFTSPPPVQTAYQPQQYAYAPTQMSQPPDQAANPWASSRSSHPYQQAANPSQYSLHRQTSATYSSPTKESSAPPPVDLASHPSSSPKEYTSNLPSAPIRSESYTSTVSHVDQTQTPVYAQQPQHPPTHSQQQYPQQQYTSPLQQAAPSLHPHQQQSSAPPQQHSQQQQQQQHVYSANSFPQAPAAVFPDAPVAEPQGLEKKEQEEALLIEL